MSCLQQTLNWSFSVTPQLANQSKFNLTILKYFRLVERFLLNDYEERTSSTHALTMYRHNTNHKGKDYKIGKFKILDNLVD